LDSGKWRGFLKNHGNISFSGRNLADGASRFCFIRLCKQYTGNGAKTFWSYWDSEIKPCLHEKHQQIRVQVNSNYCRCQRKHINCVGKIHSFRVVNDSNQAEMRDKVGAVSFIFVACGQIPPGGRNIIWRLMVIRQVKKLPTVCGTLRLRTVPTRPVSVPCGEPLESNCHCYKAIYKMYVDMTTAVPRYAGWRARCFVFRRCGGSNLCSFFCGYHHSFESNTGIITSEYATAVSFHFLYK